MDTHEDRLIRQARTGDTEAFDQVFAAHLSPLLAYCRALGANYEQARAAVEETGVLAFRNLSRFAPESDFGGWLRSIARRQVQAPGRRWRRLSRTVERVLDEVYAEPPSAVAVAERAALTTCLQQLPETMRAVLRTHYFEGHPPAVVAERLKLSAATVQAALLRAREELRDCVRRRLETGGAP